VARTVKVLPACDARPCPRQALMRAHPDRPLFSVSLAGQVGQRPVVPR